MKFKKLIKFAALSFTLAFFTVSCEQDVATENNLSGNYIGLSRVNAPINLEEGQVVSVEAKVVASKSVNVDRVVDLELIYTSPQNTTAAPNTVAVTTANPANFTVPTSVTIPAGETEASFQVSVTGIDLGAGKNILIGIVPKDGVDLDTRYANTLGSATYEILAPRLLLRLQPICNLNPLRIGISLDRYGSESSWELYDNADLTAPIATGGPYTDGTNSTVRPQPNVDICLPNGNYTFVMYDAYGDGMSSGTGEGFYKLSKMNPTWSTEVELIKKNGTFGANDVVEFSFP